MSTQALSDLTPLDQKVREVFGSLAMDKRRIQDSGLRQYGVPRFVEEWILEQIVPGIGPLTAAERDKLIAFAERAIPKKNDQEVYRSRLVQGATVKVLTFMQVKVILNQKVQEHRAEVPALGIDHARIEEELVNSNEDLLRGGLWGIIELHQFDADTRVIGFRPMASQVNLEKFAECRRRFSDAEWRDLMLASAGYEPAAYDFEAQTWVLSRLLPVVQPNYHCMELAPKGTGKSFIFENISPRVRLVSGGKVTPAQMFVDNRTGAKGFLGRYDAVVLDEVQSLEFDNPDEIVGVLKGYLANGQLTRASKVSYASDCGLVLLANIPLDERQQPLSENLIETLPDLLHETALLDRFQGIIPGWRVPKFQRRMVAERTAFKADFFFTTLAELRFDGRYEAFVRSRVHFPQPTNKRDEDAIIRTATGLLKLLHPHLEVDADRFERECLWPAINMRQYVRNQLWSDPEYHQTPKALRAEVDRRAWPQMPAVDLAEVVREELPGDEEAPF